MRRRRLTDTDSASFPVKSRSLYKKTGGNREEKKEEKVVLPAVRRDQFESLSGWNPFKGLEGLFNGINTIFDRFAEYVSDMEVCPETDIHETGDSVVVRAEIPGLSKDNLDVDVFEDQIRLSGKQHRKDEYRNTDENVYRKEEYYRAFYKVLPLPAKVKYNQAKVDYKGDILTVIVPKDTLH
jgi:HSP20 family protein